MCIAVHEKLMQQMVSGIARLQEVYYQEDMREHPLVDEFYQIIKGSKKFSDRLLQIQNLMNEAWGQSAAFKHTSFASEMPKNVTNLLHLLYFSVYC